MARQYSRTSKDAWWQRLFGGGVQDTIHAFATGGVDAGINALKRNALGIDTSPEETEELLKYLEDSLPESHRGYWNSLPEGAQKKLLDEYFEEENSWNNLWGLAGTREVFDEQRFLNDLQELNNAAVNPGEGLYQDAIGAVNVPVRPDANVLRQEAIDAINAENQIMYDRYDEQEALLDELKANRTASYEQSLADTRAGYNTARTGLMSQQYQNNTRLMDTMQSQMSKAQRNALEAGASAGLRIAGNVNALLSAQNKQSQQSLETSNQLAQMMLNQRAAERGLRNDYDNYMSQDAARRASIDQGRNDILTSTQGRVNDRWSSEYSAKKTAYDENVTDWKSAYEDNPFSDSYFKYSNKSKYTGGA